MSKNTILQAKNVGKEVISPEGLLTILKSINLTIQQGESLAIVGVSGSGKSTLLGLLAGLDTPSTGNIMIDDVDITVLDEDGRARVRKQAIGFIFQSFHLLEGLTALENVMLTLELTDSPNAEQIALQCLQDVNLQHRLHHYPNQLSGGEQQRVAIARAFANQPRILFADEPTGNLDQKTAQHIIDLLFKMNKEKNTTLILVTHDQMIADYCDRTITIAGGELVKS